MNLILIALSLHLNWAIVPERLRVHKPVEDRRSFGPWTQPKWGRF